MSARQSSAAQPNHHDPSEFNPPKAQVEWLDVDPYSYLNPDGTINPTKFNVQGLLTQGGISALGGKSKQGKTSLSRFLATRVSKGLPFFGKETQQGEVILVNLEDPHSHAANHLRVLGYDKKTDARISIVPDILPRFDDNIEALANKVAKLPDTKLVIIDHIGLFAMVSDFNEYSPLMKALTAIRKVSREFSKVNIMFLAHCGKAKKENPYDSFLGSSSIRAVPDTNMVLFEDDNQRLLAAECRMGMEIHPTLLTSEVEVIDDTTYLKDVQLSSLLSEHQSEKAEKTEKRHSDDYEQRVVEFLKTCKNTSAESHRKILEGVQGRRQSVNNAITALKRVGVIVESGSELRLDIESPTSRLYGFGKGFAVPTGAQTGMGSDMDYTESQGGSIQ